VATLFAPPVPRYSGISSQAFVHQSSVIGSDVSIYPLVYVGENALIGNGSTLFPGVFLGNRVKIGNRTILYPNVTVMDDCVIGSDVTIHAGTVIGSDGFGYVQDKDKSLKIPQMGIVQIDDEVEIGANNCIDRAAMGKTWIQRGVKTDNLVQVAHNVVLGENTIVVAQSGISGSTRVGRGVILGGQVGIADHIEIGDGVTIGSQSGVAKNVVAGSVVSGSPALPHRLWLRTTGLVSRLPQFTQRLKALEKKLEELTERLEKERG
jgi:UDP-3-O-[3-hydroxymyristoyl] glucosamine N-acyltransferase